MNIDYTKHKYSLRPLKAVIWFSEGMNNNQERYGYISAPSQPQIHQDKRRRNVTIPLGAVKVKQDFKLQSENVTIDNFREIIEKITRQVDYAVISDEAVNELEKALKKEKQWRNNNEH